MIVAFMNMKGGVGKTTLCVHLAGAAANKGKNVLIVDYDPQFNLTQHLLKPKEYFELDSVNKTVYGVLEPAVSAPQPFQVDISEENVNPPNVEDVAHRLFRIKRSNVENHVDLLLGSSKLMYLVLGKTQKTTNPLEARFHAFLNDAETKYDYIFIDCHPAGSFLTKSALVMADMVITPVVPDSYSSRGVLLMKEFLDWVSKFSNRTARMRVVFNMIPWRGGDTGIEDSIRKNPDFKDLCVAQVLHDSTSVKESGRIEGSSWQRIMQWSKKPWSARIKREIGNIYEELLANQGNAQKR